jgi:hypothetical protein
MAKVWKAVLSSALHGVVYYLKPTYLFKGQIMSNAVAIIEGTRSIVIDKKGNTGSLALAVAFAGREARQEFGQMMYANWLANGQFRPVVNDILSCGLVPKSALPFVAGLVPATGSVSKEALMGLCNAVSSAVAAKGKELKGRKAYVFGIVDRISRGAQPSTIND